MGTSTILTENTTVDHSSTGAGLIWSQFSDSRSDNWLVLLDIQITEDRINICQWIFQP